MENVLIIADIEGSSGCASYQASAFMTDEWRQACLEMTRDVNAVVTALFNAGVCSVMVKDFHRTGYNLLPEHIDSRANVVPGYKKGPVIGLGSPMGATSVMFLGMHAAAGTQGFLAHTLTSRLKKLIVNGRPMSEMEFFSGSLAPFGVEPIFFSGCPVSCSQAKTAVPGIRTHAIEKTGKKGQFNLDNWRRELAKAAVRSLTDKRPGPYLPKGPFKAVIVMKKGHREARKAAHLWHLKRKGSQLFIETQSLDELYLKLIRLCYLTPFIEAILPVSLMLFNLKGRFGLEWIRYQSRKS